MSWLVVLEPNIPTFICRRFLEFNWTVLIWANSIWSRTAIGAIGSALEEGISFRILSNWWLFVICYYSPERPINRLAGTLFIKREPLFSQFREATTTKWSSFQVEDWVPRIQLLHLLIFVLIPLGEKRPDRESLAARLQEGEGAHCFGSSSWLILRVCISREWDQIWAQFWSRFGSQMATETAPDSQRIAHGGSIWRLLNGWFGYCKLGSLQRIQYKYEYKYKHEEPSEVS